MRKYLPYCYTILVAANFLMVWIYPVDPSTQMQRHLTLAQARILSLIIILSVGAVWWLAYHGARTLMEYAHSIRMFKDGRALTQLASGVLLLVFYLPVHALLKTSLTYLAYQHPTLAGPSEAAIIYANIIIQLVVFLLISRAASNLRRLAQVIVSPREVYILSLLLSVLCVGFCAATFSGHGTITPTTWLVTAEQTLPIAVRAVTVVVPYLFIWMIGFWAVYELYLYQTFVTGVLYKKLLKKLSVGLSLVITLSILLQFFTAVADDVSRLGLGIIVGIIYALLLLLGLAFLLIAQGARRLQKLDEV